MAQALKSSSCSPLIRGITSVIRERNEPSDRVPPASGGGGGGGGGAHSARARRKADWDVALVCQEQQLRWFRTPSSVERQDRTREPRQSDLAPGTLSAGACIVVENCSRQGARRITCVIELPFSCEVRGRREARVRRLLSAMERASLKSWRSPPWRSALHLPEVLAGRLTAWRCRAYIRSISTSAAEGQTTRSMTPRGFRSVDAAQNSGDAGLALKHSMRTSVFAAAQCGPYRSVSLLHPSCPARTHATAS